ncbi:hypothetical protein KQI48_04840 [Cellulomonas hominis]|jgi:hypothetical protein|uniref:Uncharacterized protein n=1 Tax=Cellulomonas hominis TaxID=156981 RepID=A0A511F8W6_9CELL|nr:hypothetical protein [Cellulomonas hominis]MBB5472389.1 hypothetical protein [Cellulomonas hominis]MBU5421988.1 hypothetical protein [Cellulomonas hominis]NKY10485.1 hypothetical protein [Cellulomonas hominis]GEL45673.1 hypothetical protein CHO01_07890 [Cellulomonas hominis]
MHPDAYLTVHRQRDRELTREIELRRAAQDCPGCIVRAGRHLARFAERVRARLTGAGAAAAPACCPA